MKFKIIILASLMMMGSANYAMEGYVKGEQLEKVLSPQNNEHTRLEALKNQSVQDLEAKQRGALSSPVRAVSDFSQKTLGIKNQGILISAQPTIFDIELAKIRTSDNDSNKNQSIARAVTGTVSYKDQDPSNRGGTIVYNKLTNTITYKNQKGEMIRQVSKNLNGTTTELLLNNPLYPNKNYKISSGGKEFNTTRTTYATADPYGKRTVEVLLDPYYIDEQDPLLNSKATYNYNDKNKMTSYFVKDSSYDKTIGIHDPNSEYSFLTVNNRLHPVQRFINSIDNNLFHQTNDPLLKQVRQSPNQFEYDKVTGLSGSIERSIAYSKPQKPIDLFTINKGIHETRYNEVYDKVKQQEKLVQSR